MKVDRRLLTTVIGAVAAAALLLLMWVGLIAALAWTPLAPGQRDALFELLGPSLPAAVVALLVILGLVAAAVPPLYRRWVGAPARLLEQARVLVAGEAQRELEPGSGNADVRGLAQVIGELVRQRAQLRGDIAAQVEEASRNVEQERSRLAALMSELTQSVVVCNLDGRVLLYNNRARVQFRTLSQTPTLADGAELIGLGRSIYAVFDRRLVAHALENIQHRLQRGVANPSAQFVTTTRAGHLLRVQMAPVRSTSAEPGREAELNGFVLMLDNITSDFEQESARDRLLHGLTEDSRASLGNMQAAVEVLEDPDLDASMRERFHRVIHEEVHAMSGRIRTLAAQAAQQMKTRWPLEDMRGTDLVAAAQRRIEAARGLRMESAEVDDDTLAEGRQLLAAAGARLPCRAAGRGIRHQDRVAAADAGGQTRASGPCLERPGSQHRGPGKLGDRPDPGRLGNRLAQRARYRSAPWRRVLVRARSSTSTGVLPLPAATCQRAGGTRSSTFPHHAGRPEYYDFDLFRVNELSRELDERRLTELSYTVFDTETTGLDPSAGDEIIQIGATRLVNGKLLKGECFEQLVDPRRSIAAASIPIHGITPEMVVGQPTIEKVLPAFHAFAQDTVLVAHNAAFDMRFLQLKENTTGVRFEQPVLDTLLLSALMHPNQESHRLEAIAERFGVEVSARHTALGDALVTAEIFLKLLPLLAEMGIHTLGQAREATQQTYYARIKY